MMVTDEQARNLAKAALASYSTNIPIGYESGGRVDDPGTGFHAEIYRKTGTGEVIVAFTGTQPETSHDVVHDLALGTKQWTFENKDKVMAELTRLSGEMSMTKIDFTGHSLGGALAQYAAYDYAVAHRDDITRPELGLTTFNGLGGLSGLKLMNGTTFDPTVADSIGAQHFYASSGGEGGRGDLVARLGEGHFGGNTYRIDIPAGLGLGPIHSPWSSFLDLTVPATSSVPNYLNIVSVRPHHLHFGGSFRH